MLKEHNARIANDPEFQYIMKDIARFNAMKDKRNIASLNYAQREKRITKMTQCVWRVRRSV
ncbi:carboxy terminal-processing peptidase [Shigella flexneri]